MGNATKLPTSSEFHIFYWQNKPKLTSGLSASASDTTLYWSTPPYDKDGNIIDGGFSVAVTNKAGKTEQIWVPVGNVSADGLSATGCVRGIDPDGTDYTVGDADFILEHEGGSSVKCVISAQIGEMMRSVLQGLIASGGSDFIIGIDAAGTVTISRSTGTGTWVGFLRHNGTKVQFSNDGVTWTNIDSVSASNLVTVSAADTTPGYLDNKVAAGSGITKTIVNPGGNEQLQISADAIPSYTAIEAIPAGGPVAMSLTSGKVENLINAQMATPGSAAAFDTGAVTYLASCKAARDKVAVIYQESSAWFAIAGTVHPTTKAITWGTRQQVNAGAANVKPSVAYVSDNKVIFAYVDSSNVMKATVATLSGTVFTLGTEVTVKAATVTAPAVATVDTDKVMFAFNHDTGLGRVSIGTISGTTLTVDTANEQQFEANTCTNIWASKADTAKGFIAYTASSKGSSVAVSCATTTPVPGTAVDFDTNNTSSNCTSYVSAGKVFVAWRDATSNVTNARIASISGTVVSYPTAELSVSAVANCTDVRCVAFGGTGKAFVAWRDVTNSKGSVQEVVISGTTLTTVFPALDYYASAVLATTAVGMTEVNENNRFCILYSQNSNSDGYGIVGQDYSNVNKYLGIAQSTVAAEASVSVRQIGLDTNQTGLTAGTNVESQGIVIGRAVTSTSMLVVVQSYDPYVPLAYAADGGTSDDYQLDLSPPLSAYLAGQIFRFKAATANTAASTLNVNGLGAKTIKKAGNTDLETGDISATQIVEVIYDGTNFQVLSPLSNQTKYSNGLTTRTTDAASGVQTIAHDLGKSPKKVKIRTNTNAGSGDGAIRALSNGQWDASGQNSEWEMYSASGAALDLSGVSAGNAVGIPVGAAPSVTGQTGQISVDATNITITWTKNGSPASLIANIMWEASC